MAQENSHLRSQLDELAATAEQWHQRAVDAEQELVQVELLREDRDWLDELTFALYIEREQQRAYYHGALQSAEQWQAIAEKAQEELGQSRSQLGETKEDCEKQILQRENELAAEFNTLKARVAKADKLAGEIYLLLEQAYYPPEEGGVFRANNGTKARAKVNYALDLLEEFAPKLKDEPFPPG